MRISISIECNDIDKCLLQEYRINVTNTWSILNRKIYIIVKRNQIYMENYITDVINIF